MFIKRLNIILENEKITSNDSTLKKVIETYFPDIRKMIQILQQFSATNNVLNDDILKLVDIDDELYNLLL